MKCSLFDTINTREVIELYTDVFSTSENASEGELIGRLVADLIATTPTEDLTGFVAILNDRIVGCIFFSRFIVPDDRVAFILSPVAISTSEQGTGVGQTLINYGIDHLQSLSVSLVFTYGDPAYYCKTGFLQISEEIVTAPFELSQPEGWLARPLDGLPIEAMPGTSQCVEALSDQKYW